MYVSDPKNRRDLMCMKMANENVSGLLSVGAFITHKMTMMSGNRRAIRVTNDYVY